MCSLSSVCLDVSRAGRELITSEVYGRAKIEDDELRRAINEAHHVSNAALAPFRGSSDSDSIEIQLEPIPVRDGETQDGAFCSNESPAREALAKGAYSSVDAPRDASDF